MAIIDSKVVEEAHRQEREYAQRNDTASASQDWQVPPPAYEEAPTATSSTSQSVPSTSHGAQGEEEQHRSSSRQRERHAASMTSDETLPLLTRRQEIRLRKKLRRRSKLKKGLRLIIVTLFMASLILLILNLTGLLDAGDVSRYCSRDDALDTDFSNKMLPNPIESDGEIIESPVWSPGVKTNPDLWPDNQRPLFSSFTNFTFDAFKSHFVHEYSNGAINSGQVNIANADPLPDEEWQRWNVGSFYDRIFVQVEARYTEVALRDSIRMNKMKISGNKEGLGIYGARPRIPSLHPYISFHIFVYLPSSKQRTPKGIDKDGSSFIPELDLDIDNFRIGIEAMQNVDKKGTGYITFGNLKTRQSNGPMTFVHGLRANNSIDIHLQNGPVLDLKGMISSYSMLAPRININVVNGPIWISKLIARDEISLKTTNGGINITDIAIAKSIQVKHATGVSAGLYRAQKLDVSTTDSDTDITVDLTPDLFGGIPGLEEERNQGLACQHRQVNTHTDTGDMIVNYQNQDPQVQLHSRLTVGTGSIRVNHDRTFEGTFSAGNKLGTVEISDPHFIFLNGSREKNDVQIQHPVRKILVITKARSGSSGKTFEGRTWWPDHSWNDKDKFCRSFSHTSTGVGRLAMHF